MDEKGWQRKIRLWRAEPWTFGREVLKCKEFDPKQIELMSAFADPEVKRITVKASTGTGKTYTEGVLVWNFISCYGDREDPPKGLLTAIDGSNMESNLWAEIARFYEKSEYLKQFFVMQDKSIFAKEMPKTWFVERRTWETRGGENSWEEALGLSGHHAKYSLFMVDESGGVPAAVIQAGDRTLVNWKPGDFCKVIQCGNPTHSSGPLYDSFKKEGEKDRWYKITMTGDPDDPECSTRINKDENRALINSRGKNDPYVQVYVFGEFPYGSFYSFLGPGDVEAAFNRDYPMNAYTLVSPRAGIDVAYDGTDRSFFFPRQGIKAFDPVELKVNLSSPTIGHDMANMIEPHHRLLGIQDEIFDATGGYANAVMEAMRMLGIAAIPIKFNQKASDDYFENIRAEMYWRASQWVKNNGALPRVKGLLDEACAARYTITRNHKMIVEDKKLIKKRLGRSPDLWEAFILTFALPEKSNNFNGINADGMQVGTMTSVMDLNPYSVYPKRQQTNSSSLADHFWGGRK